MGYLTQEVRRIALPSSIVASYQSSAIAAGEDRIAVPADTNFRNLRQFGAYRVMKNNLTKAHEQRIRF
jgi:hypothetical protein